MVRSLGLRETDILGWWSFGGLAAQVLAINYQRLVRKVILAATMPACGSPEVVWNPNWLEAATNPVPSIERARSLFFTDSAASRAAGGASFAPIPHSPATSVSVTAIAARSSAIRRFASNADGWCARPKPIAAPTFVANGDRDGLFPAVDSAVLAREIPWSRLGIYPDSGHAFLFQYVDRFSDDVLRFPSDA